MTNSESNLFSILIPTWNNLDFLKLCIESIRKNSCFQHQIIVYVNDGSDGTLDWVRSMGGWILYIALTMSVFVLH